mmetsp:Transcript_16715/g.24764  ORF Transcript_16715/g.24764 Transcript_16715/m.24764 type:complete len:97 (+) Transcript_16715:957-1247(+)
MALNLGAPRLRNGYTLVHGVFGTENIDCDGPIMAVVSLLFDLGRFPSACIQCTNLVNQLGCAVFVSKADVTVPYEPFPISFRSEYLVLIVKLSRPN